MFKEPDDKFRIKCLDYVHVTFPAKEMYSCPLHLLKKKRKRKRVAVNRRQLVQLGLKLFEYTNHLSNVKLPERNSFFEWGNLLSPST